MVNPIELDLNAPIYGTDEVGRGCLAGPIVAGCVGWDLEWVKKMLQEEDSEEYKNLVVIKDSKKITKKNREKLSGWILENASYTKVIEIPAEEIDQIGIQKANKSAMVKSLPLERKEMTILTDYINIDNELEGQGREDLKSTPILHGEDKSLSIAAASIIAKVYRDNLMAEKYAREFPEYSFEKNVGYGTRQHLEAIGKYGYTPIHRKSFHIMTTPLEELTR